MADLATGIRLYQDLLEPWLEKHEWLVSRRDGGEFCVRILEALEDEEALAAGGTGSAAEREAV